MNTPSRIVCWFSCGAASAVATKLVIEENAKGLNLPIVVVRCYIAEEHPDNDRFSADCARWFGMPITTLQNDKYKGSTIETFTKRKYMAGINGAACTLYLKKEVTNAFVKDGDLQVWGFTAEEEERQNRVIDAHNEFRVWPILIEKGLMHADCLAIVSRAGIELPAMYKMGYQHNNCIGCVKAGAGYWNKIRVDFPERFKQIADIEQAIGAKLIKLSTGRVSLHDLPVDAGEYHTEPEIQCGIFCEMAEREMAA